MTTILYLLFMITFGTDIVGSIGPYHVVTKLAYYETKANCHAARKYAETYSELISIHERTRVTYTCLPILIELHPSTFFQKKNMEIEL